MDFTEKIFPSETLEINLPISKQEFIIEFKKITTPRDINFFSEFAEPFINNKKKFIGNITSSSSFEIKRYRRIFKNYQGKAVCYGIIKEDFEKITVKCKIISFRGYFKQYLLVSLLIMPIWFISINNIEAQISFSKMEFLVIIPLFLIFFFFNP